jgi:hypothetical protein
MREYRSQFKYCKAEGFHGVGPYIDYEKNPEMLPFNPILAKKLKEREKGFNMIACLRFGGVCSSGHPDCKKLRTTNEF